MKKLLSLLLVAAMGLSLVGCGGSDNGSKSESKSDLEYVKNKGTLVVGVTDFAPMDYKATGSDLTRIWHPHLQRALG